MPLIPFFTSLIAPVVNYVGGRLGGRSSRHAAACAAFRDAFATELQGLYPEPVQWPERYGIDGHLRSRFKARAAFDDAWLTYYSSLKRRNEESYDHYYSSGGVSMEHGLIVARREPEDGKRYFKENVDRLLAFATAL
jgi:hypothetical protein